MTRLSDAIVHKLAHHDDVARPNKPLLNSAVAIARLLGTEGFTDHVANECERYHRRNSVLTERQKHSLERVERAFSEMVQEKLSDADRLVLGKFIGWQKKLSFDTGLRIGLQAFATKHATNEDHIADASNMVDRECHE